MEEWVWYKCPMESSKESPTLEWYQWEVLKLDHSNVFSFCLVMFVGHWRQIIWLDDRRKHVEINICLLWECLKTPLKQNGTSMSAKNWRHSTICNWKYHRFRDPPHSWTTPPIHVCPGLTLTIELWTRIQSHLDTESCFRLLHSWHEMLLPLLKRIRSNSGEEKNSAVRHN